MKLKVRIGKLAQEFLDALDTKVQQKIYFNIFKVEEGIIDSELFKKLENTEIWEFRTLFGGNCYRLFAFWDETQRAIIIVTHGIVKKTQKTPLKEIRKAEELMKEHYDKRRLQ